MAVKEAEGNKSRNLRVGMCCLLSQSSRSQTKASGFSGDSLQHVSQQGNDLSHSFIHLLAFHCTPRGEEEEEEGFGEVRVSQAHRQKSVNSMWTNKLSINLLLQDTFSLMSLMRCSAGVKIASVVSLCVSVYNYHCFGVSLSLANQL